MTNKPPTPNRLHVQRFDDAMVYHVKAVMGATIPNPYSRIAVDRRGNCEVCGTLSLWPTMPEPMLCRYRRDLAAYAALPWWRRALTRKPKP